MRTHAGVRVGRRRRQVRVVSDSDWVSFAEVERDLGLRRGEIERWIYFGYLDAADNPLRQRGIERSSLARELDFRRSAGILRRATRRLWRGLRRVVSVVSDSI